MDCALFHLEQSAACGDLQALVAMAEIYLQLPHDLLAAVTVQVMNITLSLVLYCDYSNKSPFFGTFHYSVPSSETQGQVKGARESLNGRKNIYGTKKSKERREEPLGTLSYQTSSKRSLPFCRSRRSLLFFAPHFSTRLDFPSSPLSAPGSPRMILYKIVPTFESVDEILKCDHSHESY